MCLRTCYSPLFSILSTFPRKLHNQVAASCISSYLAHSYSIITFSEKCFAVLCGLASNETNWGKREGNDGMESSDWCQIRRYSGKEEYIFIKRLNDCISDKPRPNWGGKLNISRGGYQHLSDTLFARFLIEKNSESSKEKAGMLLTEMLVLPWNGHLFLDTIWIIQVFFSTQPPKVHKVTKEEMSRKHRRQLEKTWISDADNHDNNSCGSGKRVRRLFCRKVITDWKEMAVCTFWRNWSRLIRIAILGRQLCSINLS